MYRLYDEVWSDLFSCMVRTIMSYYYYDVNDDVIYYIIILSKKNGYYNENSEIEIFLRSNTSLNTKNKKSKQTNIVWRLPKKNCPNYPSFRCCYICTYLYSTVFILYIRSKVLYILTSWHTCMYKHVKTNKNAQNNKIIPKL